MTSFDPKFGLRSNLAVAATWLFVVGFTVMMVRAIYLMFFAAESNRRLLQDPIGAGIGLLTIFVSFYCAFTPKSSPYLEQLRKYGLHSFANLFGRLERIFAFEFGLLMSIALVLHLWFVPR